MSVGEEVRRLRKRRGLTQTELANIANSLPEMSDLHLSRQTICYIENGDYVLTFRQAIAICEALNVPLNQLGAAMARIAEN
jgi:DNA-binding XRE family transcriptional regulator